MSRNSYTDWEQSMLAKLSNQREAQQRKPKQGPPPCAWCGTRTDGTPDKDVPKSRTGAPLYACGPCNGRTWWRRGTATKPANGSAERVPKRA